MKGVSYRSATLNCNFLFICCWTHFAQESRDPRTRGSFVRPLSLALFFSVHAPAKLSRPIMGVSIDWLSTFLSGIGSLSSPSFHMIGYKLLQLLSLSLPFPGGLSDIARAGRSTDRQTDSPASFSSSSSSSFPFFSPIESISQS